MKIVKFKNGKYGIRKGVWEYEFWDFFFHRWRLRDVHIPMPPDCQRDLPAVQAVFEAMTDCGIPV